MSGPAKEPWHVEPICTAGSCSSHVAPECPAPLCADHARLVFAWVLAEAQAHSAITDTPDHQATPAPEGPRWADMPGHIYYVRIGNHVKIGWTSNLKHRFTSLQPDQVLATQPGTLRDERELHHRFGYLLAKGREYFHPGPALVDHIASIRACE